MAEPAAAFPNFEPKRVKVFGVMHIVFGGLGFGQVLGNLAMTPFQKQIMSFSSMGSPDEVMEAQLVMMEKLKPFTWISIVITLILASLIMRAGLRLVKKKPGALPASNLYAWCSIGAKAILLILFFVMVQPIYNEMFESMFDDTTPGADEALLVMRIATSVGGILGPLVTMVYPILALTMLNKKIVKDYFSGLQ